MKKINLTLSHFRVVTIILLLNLFLFSCNRDELAVEKTPDKSIQNYKINSIQKISYDKLLESLPSESLNKDLKFSFSPPNSKTLEEFDIDTADVNQIQFGDIGNTYTLKIVPKSGENTNDELYNLVVSQTNESIEYEVIKYTLENGKLVIDESHIETEYSTSNRFTCRTVVSPCEFGYMHDDEDCVGSGATKITVCTGDNGGGSGGGPGNPTGDGPTVPTGNHYNPQDGGGNSSYPYEFYYYLTTQQVYWLNQRPSISQGIDNYLRTSPDVEQALDFAQWATNFLMQNSGMTWAQFQSKFITGYNPQYQYNIAKLSVQESQQLVAINNEITTSPDTEEYLKETNEAFAAFGAYADVENMTEEQMESVLSQCCPSIIIFPQALVNQKADMIIANYQFNRKFYPEWSKAKCFWKATQETIQLLLDLGGLVPVIGEVCDLTNGVIYTINGDGLNASLSYASAIPIAGWFAAGTKFGVKVANASDIASRQVLKYVVGTDGIIKFGYSNQLRKVLKLTDVTKQAHHIIPWSLHNNSIVQKAAKSSNAFHLNEALNGIAVASWRNQPNHNAYNNRILEKLNSLPSNLTPDQAYASLITILNQAKQAVINNPNTHLNDLIF